MNSNAEALSDRNERVKRCLRREFSILGNQYSHRRYFTLEIVNASNKSYRKTPIPGNTTLFVSSGCHA